MINFFSHLIPKHHSICSSYLIFLLSKFVLFIFRNPKIFIKIIIYDEEAFE